MATCGCRSWLYGLVLVVAGVASCTGDDTGGTVAGQPPPSERPRIDDLDLEARVAELEHGQDGLAAGLATAGDRIEGFLRRLREVIARNGQVAGSQDGGAGGPPWGWLGCLLVALAAGWFIGRRSRQPAAPSLDHPPADRNPPVTVLPSTQVSNGRPPGVTAKIIRRPGAAAVCVELEIASADAQRARGQLDRWFERDPRVLDLPAPKFVVEADRVRVQFHLIARAPERRRIPSRVETK